MPSVLVDLTVRDLTDEDLPSCAWTGSATHLKNVAEALERVRQGKADHLAICPPSGVPVAIGGIDYSATPDAGVLWALVVHPALRSCGIGSVLVRSAEERIVKRGLSHAELGVEESNPRARALYERLGYTACGKRPESWMQEAPDGSVFQYETVCTIMRKAL